MKTCTRCGFESNNPTQDFPADKKRKDGLNSWCRGCYAERARDWYAAHPQQAKKTRAAYYVEHTEHLIAEALKWEEANYERKLELARIRYANNPEKILAYQAELRAANPEKERLRHAKYALENPDKRLMNENRRRARKHALLDTWTHEQLVFMRTYWGYACAVCGNEEGFLWTIASDHWIPVTADNCPGTVATNMIPLCHGEKGCNNSKHNKDPHRWLLSRYSAHKTAKIEQAIAAYFAIVALRFPAPDPILP